MRKGAKLDLFFFFAYMALAVFNVMVYYGYAHWPDALMGWLVSGIGIN